MPKVKRVCRRCGEWKLDATRRKDRRFWCDACWLMGSNDALPPIVSIRSRRAERARQLYKGLQFPDICIDKSYVVYFIADEHNRIKIGKTKNVKQRLAGLQTNSADILMLLATEPGRGRREGELHRQFAHLHVGGEWFRAADDLLEYVAKLPICET